MTLDQMTTTGRLQELEQKRESVFEKLKSARKDFLSARARRNYLESQLERIDEEIELLSQGQLCLGDSVDSKEMTA